MELSEKELYDIARCPHCASYTALSVGKPQFIHGGPGSISGVVCSNEGCALKFDCLCTEIEKGIYNGKTFDLIMSSAKTADPYDLRAALERLGRLDALYKYVRPERISILRDNLIGISPAYKTNDITEISPELSAGKVDEIARNGIRRRLQRNRLRLKGETGYEVQIQDEDSFIESVLEMEKQSFRTNPALLAQTMTHGLKATIGFLSLTEGWSNDNLWNFYADNYRGMVFGFNPFAFCSEPIMQFWGEGFPSPVVYNANPTIDSPACLFEKGLAWAGEAEWRVIRRLSECKKLPDSDIYLLPVKPESIWSVTLDARARDGLLKQVVSLCEENERLHHVSVRLRVQDYGRNFHLETVRQGHESKMLVIIGLISEGGLENEK